MKSLKINQFTLKSTGLGIIGTQSSTMNLIDGLMRGGCGVDCVITLPPHLSASVADYQDLQGYCSRMGIPVELIESYGMKDDQTRVKLEALQLEWVVVVGWQRLIPEWFLKRIPKGVYGMHGSSMPLPKGRGRSPMNWSILEGKERFYSYLFRYDPGIDSGDIVDCQRFDICTWDTIQSLQHKNTVSQYKLVLKNMPQIVEGSLEVYPQENQVTPSYYPKRTPDDGAIDWSQWTARELHALIRCVTWPYPGAFTKHRDSKIYIWRAAPFDSNLEYQEFPGNIVEVFTDSSFVVKCFVDTLLVLEYETIDNWEPEVGQCFISIPNDSWQKLARMKLGEKQNV